MFSLMITVLSAKWNYHEVTEVVFVMTSQGLGRGWQWPREATKFWSDMTIKSYKKQPRYQPALLEIFHQFNVLTNSIWWRDTDGISSVKRVCVWAQCLVNLHAGHNQRDIVLMVIDCDSKFTTSDGDEWLTYYRSRLTETTGKRYKLVRESNTADRHLR